MIRMRSSFCWIGLGRLRSGSNPALLHHPVLKRSGVSGAISEIAPRAGGRLFLLNPDLDTEELDFSALPTDTLLKCCGNTN